MVNVTTDGETETLRNEPDEHTDAQSNYVIHKTINEASSPVQLRRPQATKDVPMIPTSEIKDVHYESIGSGAFGTVFHGLWQDRDVALKVLKLESDKLHREASHLCRLAHPNVIRFYGICDVSFFNSPALVMEFAHGGALNRVINACPVLAPSTLFNWALQVATGMAYLHVEARLVHRDLKSCNILIREALNTPYTDENLRQCTLLITDFGMACRSSELISPQSKLGTIAYAAPEVCCQKASSFHSDVWSFGIVLWELLTLKEPHRNIDPFRLYYMIGKYNYTPFIPETVPELFSELLHDCWAHHPTDRPTFPEIIRRLEASAYCDFLNMDAEQFYEIQSDWRDMIDAHDKHERGSVALLSSSSTSIADDSPPGTQPEDEALNKKLDTQAFSDWESLDQYHHQLLMREYELGLKEQQYSRLVGTITDNVIALAVLAANHQLNSSSSTIEPSKCNSGKRPFYRLFSRNRANSSSSNPNDPERGRCRSRSKQKPGRVMVNGRGSPDRHTESPRDTKRKPSRSGRSTDSLDISAPLNMQHVVHVDRDWMNGSPVSPLNLFPFLYKPSTINQSNLSSILQLSLTPKNSLGNGYHLPPPTSLIPNPTANHVYVNLPRTSPVSGPSRPRVLDFRNRDATTPTPTAHNPGSLSSLRSTPNGQSHTPPIPGIGHSGSLFNSSFTSESDILTVRKWSEQPTLTHQTSFSRDRNASLPLTYRHPLPPSRSGADDRQHYEHRPRDRSPDTGDTFDRRRSASGPILMDSGDPVTSVKAKAPVRFRSAKVRSRPPPVSAKTTDRARNQPFPRERPSVPSALFSALRLVMYVYQAFHSATSQSASTAKPKTPRADDDELPLKQVDLSEARRRYQSVDRINQTRPSPGSKASPTTLIAHRVEYGDPHSPFLGTLAGSGRRPSATDNPLTAAPERSISLPRGNLYNGHNHHRPLRPDNLFHQSSFDSVTRTHHPQPSQSSPGYASPSNAFSSCPMAERDYETPANSTSPSDWLQSCNQTRRSPWANHSPVSHHCQCCKHSHSRLASPSPTVRLRSSNDRSRDAYLKAIQDGYLNHSGEALAHDDIYDELDDADDVLDRLRDDEDGFTSSFRTGQDEDGLTLVPSDSLEVHRTRLLSLSSSWSELNQSTESFSTSSSVSSRRHVQRSPAMRYSRRPYFPGNERNRSASASQPSTRYTPSPHSQPSRAHRAPSPCGPYVSDHSTLL